MGPSPAKVLPYMHIRPWWHSGTKLCPISSLLHDFFPSDKWAPFLPKLFHTSYCLLFSSSLVEQWDPVMPNYFPTCKFIPAGTVGPTSAIYFFPTSRFFPYWYSEIRLLSSSSLVVQWDPVLPNYLPKCKFILGGTVRPTSALILPCFTISSLLVQWDLPPL